jgi:hypothetical protein
MSVNYWFWSLLVSEEGTRYFIFCRNWTDSALHWGDLGQLEAEPAQTPYPKVFYPEDGGSTFSRTAALCHT